MAQPADIWVLMMESIILISEDNTAFMGHFKLTLEFHQSTANKQVAITELVLQSYTFQQLILLRFGQLMVS